MVPISWGPSPPALAPSTMICATARTWTWSGGWRSRLAGPVRPRCVHQPRGACDLDPAAGAEVPLWILGGAARAQAPGAGAAAGAAGLAGRGRRRAAGPQAGGRARRVRGWHQPAGPAAARLGRSAQGRAPADGRFGAADLAGRRPLDHPVRAAGGRGRAGPARRPEHPDPAGPPAGGGVAAAGPPVAEWRRIRPPLPAAAFALGYLADEAAYGAGVYRGVLAEKLLSPLLPTAAWRPLGKAPAATRPGVHPGRDRLP